MVSTANTELLTIREAAEILRVSEVTISRWIKQGRLPSIRIGPRTVRIQRIDIDNMLTPAVDAPLMRFFEFPAEATSFEIPPLTKDEVDRGLKALEEARQFRKDVMAQRGGKPFPSSTEIIREEREKRSRQLAG